MNKLVFKYWMWCAAILIVMMTGCEEDEPAQPAPELLEVTTVRYTLIDPGADNTKVFYYQDLDGTSGAAEPTIEVDTLDANALYFGELELLNEASTPIQIVSDTIEQNKTDYQFFFIINDSDASLQYADGDDNNNPVGAFTALRTNESSDGTITINLQFQPNKLGLGVRDGDILNAGGRTNIQVTFPLIVR